MNLLSELKRRNVFKVGVAYLALGWVVIQVTSMAVPALNLPETLNSIVFYLGLIGFPFAIFFAWAFEMTPEGVKPTGEVDADVSITHTTGKKLEYFIIGMLALALVGVIYDSYLSPTTTDKAVSDGKYSSIAVLPFSNLSNNPETDSFAAGLHDDLLTQLSKIHNLTVISRTSVLKYADTKPSLIDVGNELGVTTIVEGGVQRAGDRIRLNIQLIDAATDNHIWAETYNRVLTVDNVFDIQEEITREIASALNAALSPSEEENITLRPTNNLAAFDAYMNAKILFGSPSLSLSTFERPHEEILKAVKIDPDFAEAWALAAEIYLYSYWFEGRSSDDFQRANEALIKAEKIRPDAAEVLKARAYYYYWGFLDYDRAVNYLNKAVAVRPGYGEAYEALGTVYRRAGFHDEAIKAYRKAEIINPNNPNFQYEPAMAHWYYHHFSEAEELLTRAEKRYSDNPDVKMFRSMFTHFKTGKAKQHIKQSLDILQKYEHSSDGTKLDYVYFEGLYGDKNKAINYLDQWAPSTIDTQVDYWLYALFKGYILYHRGQIAEGRMLAEKTLPLLAAARNNEPHLVTIEIAYGRALAMTGRKKEAAASAERIREIFPISKDFISGPYHHKAAIGILAMSGNTEMALNWLDEYLEFKTSFTLANISNDPDFSTLLDHPRFKAMIDKYGLIPLDRGASK